MVVQIKLIVLKFIDKWVIDLTHKYMLIGLSSPKIIFLYIRLIQKPYFNNSNTLFKKYFLHAIICFLN